MKSKGVYTSRGETCDRVILSVGCFVVLCPSERGSIIHGLIPESEKFVLLVLNILPGLGSKELHKLCDFLWFGEALSV